MAEFDAGDTLLPVEYLAGLEAGRLLEEVKQFSKRCSCLVVDYPAVTPLRVGETVEELAIGPGSILCRGRCGGYLELAGPAKVYGRWLPPPGALLRYLGPEEAASESGVSELFSIKPLDSLEGLVEAVRRGERAVAVLDTRLDPLFLKGSRVCGRPAAVNPLHPSGALAKAAAGGDAICVELVEPASRMSRMLEEVVSIEGKPLLSRLRGLGEALISHTCSLKQDQLLKMFLLGVVYTLGLEQP